MTRLSKDHLRTLKLSILLLCFQIRAVNLIFRHILRRVFQIPVSLLLF